MCDVKYAILRRKTDENKKRKKTYSRCCDLRDVVRCESVCVAALICISDIWFNRCGSDDDINTHPFAQMGVCMQIASVQLSRRRSWFVSISFFFCWMGACLIRNKLDVLLMNRFVMVWWHFSLRRINFFYCEFPVAKMGENATRNKMKPNANKSTENHFSSTPHVRNTIKCKTVWRERTQHSPACQTPLASTIRVYDWLNESVSDMERWIP